MEMIPRLQFPSFQWQKTVSSWRSWSNSSRTIHYCTSPWISHSYPFSSMLSRLSTSIYRRCLHSFEFESKTHEISPRNLPTYRWRFPISPPFVGEKSPAHDYLATLAKGRSSTRGRPTGSKIFIGGSKIEGSKLSNPQFFTQFTEINLFEAYYIYIY